MKYRQYINSLLKLIRNPYLRFFVTSVAYTCWVLWLNNLWFLAGLIVIFDIYHTKWVNWRFWRKRKITGTKHKFSTELLDSLIIAFLLAIFIRTFFVEAYTIPTSSMEKTLNIGDYIFVSKMSYGPRLPMTPLTIPFTHNVLPFTRNSNSFISALKLPYKRLSGVSSIKNFDVVVFNYPEGDTVIKDLPEKSYYQYVRQFGWKYIHDKYKLLFRPVDKRDNYIKRVVGLPGDVVRIIHGIAFVNVKPELNQPGCQYNYSVKSRGTAEDTAIFNILAVSLYDVNFNSFNSIYSVPFTRDTYHTLLDSGYFKAIVKYENTDASSVNKQIFPFDPQFQWTEDNYGPLTVPKKGYTISLTTENLSIYRRIITAYEGNNLKLKGDSIFINDTLADKYTFRMDYYFMLGDNRHNSNDSRFWGFVPENHLIGKATMVWFSIDGNKKWPDNIRWNKMFKFIQ